MTVYSRPPRGGRGLKCQLNQLLPVFTRSRPPRGGRGLKSPVRLDELQVVESPPSRGAWIEIKVVLGDGTVLIVAPLAGGVD